MPTVEQAIEMLRIIAANGQGRDTVADILRQLEALPKTVKGIPLSTML
jgi:hypothetical protein